MVIRNRAALEMNSQSSFSLPFPLYVIWNHNLYYDCRMYTKPDADSNGSYDIGQDDPWRNSHDKMSRLPFYWSKGNFLTDRLLLRQLLGM